MRKWLWSLILGAFGFMVGMWWWRDREATRPTLYTDEQETVWRPATPAVPTEPTVKKPPVIPDAETITPPDTALTDAAAVTPDPLTEINGIGPAFEQALNALGIYTFAQLAAQDAVTLAEQMDARGITAERIQRDRWIEQAQSRTL
jgi:predicted flap endonuclease-1-like 5' DNA nuclease